MSDTFLYEFMYRGRPTGSAEPPGWHVVLGQYVTPPGGMDAQFVSSPALTPEQAERAGFPLATVLAGIDAAALVTADTARADAATARGERDEALAARNTADKSAADVAAGLMAERDALAAKLAALEAKPAPSAVSDRQFFQALASSGTITQAEALAAVRTGELPARIEAAVAALPEAQQFAARMLLSGATTFERAHPMVAQLGAALGYDDKALDALWAAAAAL